MTEIQSVSTEQPRQLDSTEVAILMERLRSEQSVGAAAAAGAVAAGFGAVAWAAVTVFTRYQIGFMAVGVGLLVAWAVRTRGKGVDRVFALIGAGLSLAGCLLGNLLAACGMVAQDEGVGFFAILAHIDLQMAKELMASMFSPMDLLFYGIAVYEGYRLSIRRLTRAEMASRLAG